MRSSQLSVVVVLSLLIVAAACDRPTSPQFAPTSARALFKKDPGTKNNLFFDAAQPTADLARNPLAIYPLDPDPAVYGEHKQNVAQSFTPSADVALHYLYLPIACAEDVLIHIQIRDGGPSGPVLFRRSYDPAKRFADGAFLAFQIDGLALSGGATYAIVLSSDPARGVAFPLNTCSIIPGPVGDSYAGGTGFYTNPGFPSYWIPLPVGALPGEDLPFRTLVR